jgi:hypothetical protein
MKRLMKTIIGAAPSARALVSLLALAMPLGMSGTARAGGESQVCGPQTLHGPYVFTARGFDIVSGVAQPKAIVEGIDFNGDGTLSVPFATLSINGFIIQVPPGGVGTYTVETSCQGTLSFTNGPTYNLFVSSKGKQVSMIQTTANTVFQGTATRVSR